MNDVTNREMQRDLRHHDAIDTLMEIARTLASPRDIGEILEQIMLQVSRLLNPKAWSLLLRDEETGELEFAVVVSEIAEKLKGVRLPRGQGVAGWVADHGEAVIIPDVSRDERFAMEFDKSFSFKTRSLACVPLKCQNKVFGVIELINSLEEREFNQFDMQVLTTIADFAGIAIFNERAIARIKLLVITDDLTGLYNAKYIFDQLEYEVERAKRYSTQVSLVFLDLDRFKNVNDTHGHLVGSALLAEVGELVRKHIRCTDKGARYGGDEFVILLPQTDKAGALSLAHKLHRAIQSEIFPARSNKNLKITGSFGVATYPEDAKTSSDLIISADTAMYRAKDLGRNSVCVAGSDGIDDGCSR
ncbi:MAG TPA: sensor domain-containing diguanylate cyclase [Geobacteraceae bacterium]|nr:sensor domain-containing diguanylate cyclase [Geobacteraceae bacterium]